MFFFVREISCRAGLSVHHGTLRQFLSLHTKKAIFSRYALTLTPQNNGSIKCPRVSRKFAGGRIRNRNRHERTAMVLNVYTNLTVMLAGR